MEKKLNHLWSCRLQHWWKRRPEDTDPPRTTWVTCLHPTSLLLRWRNSPDCWNTPLTFSQCDGNNSIYLLLSFRQILWGMNLSGWQRGSPWISWAWRGNPSYTPGACVDAWISNTAASGPCVSLGTQALSQLQNSNCSLSWKLCSLLIGLKALHACHH